MNLSARSYASILLDRLALFLASNIRARAREKGLRNIFVPLDDLIGIRVFSTGEFETTQFDAIRHTVLPSLKNREVALDVGANIGIYTIEFSKVFQQVVSVEANPTTFKVLEANVALLDNENVTTLNLGASNQAITAQLQVPNNGNFRWATLNRWDVPGGSRYIAVNLEEIDA